MKGSISWVLALLVGLAIPFNESETFEEICKCYLPPPQGWPSSCSVGNSSTSFCSWTGVKCNMTFAQELTLTNLSPNNCSCPGYSKLTNLISLSIDVFVPSCPSPPCPRNSWATLSSLQLQTLTLLTYLRLANHVGTIPIEWNNITDLQTIDLTGWEVTGAPPDYNLPALSLPNLTTLIMSNANAKSFLTNCYRFGSSCPKAFYQIINNIRYLSLDGLSLPAFPEFPNPNELLSVDVSRNSFISFNLSMVAFNQTKLVNLSLDDNSVKLPVSALEFDLPPEDAPDFTMLSMRNTLSGTIPATKIPGTLKILRLGNSPFLTGTIPVNILGLSNLVEVELYGDCSNPSPQTSLTGTIPDEFKGEGNTASPILKVQNFTIPCTFLTGTLPLFLSHILPLTVVNFGHPAVISGQSPDDTLSFDLDYIQNLTNLNLVAITGFGTIPTQIGNLTHLQVLDFSGPRSLTNPDLCAPGRRNNMTLVGSIPTEIGLLMSLTTIILSCQNINGTIPTQVMALPNLQIFDISRQLNKTQALNGDFSSISFVNLSYLDLSFNSFYGNIPSQLSKAGFLLSLDLSSNNLNQFPTEVANLTHLTFLDISENALTQLPTEIGLLTSLRTLKIDRNLLSSTLPSQISQLSALQVLTLSWNRISNITSQPFPPNLLVLDLQGNSLSTMGSLHNLPAKLTTIDFSYNRITGTIPSKLCDFTSLQTLSLQMTQLQGTFPSCLNQTNITTVSIVATKIGGGNFPLDFGNRFRLGVDSCDLGNANFICQSGSLDRCTAGPCYTDETTICQNISLCVPPAVCALSDGWYTCKCYYGYLINDYECQIIVTGGQIALIVILVIAFVTGITLSGFFVHRKISLLDLSQLPEEISAFAWAEAQDLVRHPNWKEESIGGAKYHYSELRKGSEQYKMMNRLFLGLGGRDFVITAAYAIYNPTLIRAFISQWNVFCQRRNFDATKFFPQKWRQDDTDAQNEVDYSYNKLANSYSWNKSLAVPIIPCVHGTDFPIAKAICATGFIALSSLDLGFYGKGIYFTTSVGYAFPFFGAQRQPSILISFVIPGNVYPVTEDHLGPDTLVGRSLKLGYHSHYVLTKQNGRIPTFPLDFSESVYDEIVVSQESQIAPVFLLRFSLEHCMSLTPKWMRETTNKKTSSLVLTDGSQGLFDLTQSELSYRTEIEVAVELDDLSNLKLL